MVIELNALESVWLYYAILRLSCIARHEIAAGIGCRKNTRLVLAQKKRAHNVRPFSFNFRLAANRLGRIAIKHEWLN
jgi:hypothetical protein